MIASLCRCAAAVALAGIELGLGRSPAWPLARDDGSLVDDLAAPDSAWFTAFKCASQAGFAQRTLLALRLGLLKLGGQFGEPQIAVCAGAGKRLS